MSRLKTNYQLVELVTADEYEEFIQSVAEFTVESFAAWMWAGNSVYYLLSLWDRLVSSIPYIRSDKPHLLETLSPGITEAYITACVSSVDVILREGLEQQLRQISVIARCQFELTCSGLIQMFDPLAARYVSCCPSTMRTSCTRHLLSWLECVAVWRLNVVVLTCVGIWSLSNNP